MEFEQLWIGNEKGYPGQSKRLLIATIIDHIFIQVAGARMFPLYRSQAFTDCSLQFYPPTWWDSDSIKWLLIYMK